MSLDASGISWTDGTLNSLYGCKECSVGCRLCYAVNRVYRHSQNPRLHQDGRFDGLVERITLADGRTTARFTNRLLFDPSHLYAVLKDCKPKMIFVNEFSDLFHSATPEEVILEHFRVFKAASWHQFQVLTKRGSRLKDMNAVILRELGAWPENVWQGVSVCSAKPVEMQRIDELGATGAHLRWLSFEPWISDMNEPLRKAIPKLRAILRKNKIAWTVVGGESGSKDDTNLMTLDDARYLIQESRAAGCKVHFKQLGTALAIQLGVYSTDRGHRSKGGSPDQWPEDLNVRQWPEFSGSAVWADTEFVASFKAGEWMHFEPGGVKYPTF